MGCCGNKGSFTAKSSVVTDPKKHLEASMPKNTPDNNPASNLVKVFKAQPSKLLWFKDGITGLAKCFANSTKYTDEQIKENRDKCRGCEYSTKEDGKLTTTSQCMAPDPTRGGAACGCFILCKTQVGSCHMGKWTNLTVSATKPPDSGV